MPLMRRRNIDATQSVELDCDCIVSVTYWRFRLHWMFLICSRHRLESRHASRVEPRPRGDTQRHSHPLQPERTGGRGRLARPGRGDRRRCAASNDRHDRASQVDPDAQQLARHRLRSLDQRLSRLRAWLHLLLRAPHPRLPRFVAGDRLRIPPLREAGCRPAPSCGTVAARLRMPADCDGHQHRSLPADRGAVADHPLRGGAAARDATSLHDHHQVGPCASET